MNCIVIEINFYIFIEFIILLREKERNQNKLEITEFVNAINNHVYKIHKEFFRIKFKN